MFQNVSLGNIGNRSICEYVNVSIHSMMDMRDIALEYHQNPTSIVFLSDSYYFRYSHYFSADVCFDQLLL